MGSRSPVEDKGPGRVRHGDRTVSRAVDLGEDGGSLSSGGKSEEAEARVISLLTGDRVWSRARNVDSDWIPAHEGTDLLDVLFVHPGLDVGPVESGVKRGSGGDCGGRRSENVLGDAERGRRGMVVVYGRGGRVERLRIIRQIVSIWSKLSILSTVAWIAQDPVRYPSTPC